MKVLIIHTYYAERGGEDLVFETESKLLRKEGVDVDTLPFNNSKRKLLKFLCYPFNFASLLKTLQRLKKFKPDIVHIHNWHFAASSSVFIACKICNIPIVQTLHNYRLICPTGTLFFKRNIYLKSIYGHWGVPIKDKVYHNSFFQTFWVRIVTTFFKISGIWKIADRYIVLTPHAKEMYFQTDYIKLRDRFVVKSNFIDDVDYKPVGKKRYFLFVGRLTFDKGVNVLLDTFKNLSYELRIIGDGPLRKDVEFVAESHDNIKYVGFKSFDVIRESMSECLAIVFPTISFEGMPMTILESFACGTPVIGSKFSAMETMITDGYNGLHFEKGNSKSLRDKLQYFYSLDSKEVNLFAANSRKTYEKYYTPDQNIHELISIYQNVLDEKSGLKM